MIAFESFDIRAWSTDGLTQHLKSAWTTGKPRRVRVAANIRLAVASVAAAAVITFATPWPSMQTQSPLAEIARSLQLLQSEEVISGPPSDYWSRIAAEMQSWRPIDIPQVADLPPFI
jgi:hypothetical protein